MLFLNTLCYPPLHLAELLAMNFWLRESHYISLIHHNLGHILGEVASQPNIPSSLQKSFQLDISNGTRINQEHRNALIPYRFGHIRVTWYGHIPLHLSLSSDMNIHKQRA
jgi:hypothetical protein